MVDALKIYLCGGVAVEVGGQRLAENLFPGRQGRVALAYLVTERHRSVPRDELADVLWSDRLPPTWSTSLNAIISKLRRLLDRTGLDGANALPSAFGCYRLHLPPDAWIDTEAALDAVQEAERAIRKADGERARPPAQLARRIASAPFVPGEEGLWLDEQRDRLRDVYVRALICEAEAAMGTAEAAAFAEEILAVEPYREHGYRLLMRAHAASGNRGEALLAWERCRKLLADELGADPSAETESVYLEVLRDQPVAEPRRSGAPIPATTLVGRDEELTKLEQLIDHNRVVTLTGPGGIGKTRLALELRPQFFAALGDVADPALVPQVVASATGVEEEPGRDLVQAMSGISGLLVLDNCEHVLDAAAHVVSRIAQSSPDVRIVCTSRERLAVEGEAVFVVPPLPPDAACQLFVQRAASVGAELQSQEVRIERVCRSLDGHPLAIELAAAQLSSLGLEDVENRLADPLQTLRGGSRTSHRRYQSLDASIAWSYDLLTEAEQAAFRRLGFFTGTFTSAAAKVACPDGLESLRELVTKSLVTISLSGGTAHYRLIEPLRAFASARLDESNERDALGARLLSHYVTRIRRRDIDTDAQAVEYIEREHDAIRSVLAWAYGGGDTSGKALRLCTELRLFWQIRGLWSEGVRWMQIALMGPAATEDQRAQALVGLASLYDAQGELLACEQVATAALEHAERYGDLKTMAGALQAKGLAHARQGRPLDAERAFERALDYCPDEPERCAPLLSNLGLMAKVRGDFALASQRFEQALQLVRTAGMASIEGIILHNLAVLARAMGDKVKARRLYVKGLELAVDEAHRVTALMDLASYDTADGDLRQVPARLAEAQAACEEVGDKYAAIQILIHQGDVHHLMGQADQALRAYEEAAEQAAALGAAEKQAFALLGSARVEASYTARLESARAKAMEAVEIFEAASAAGLAAGLSTLALIDALEGNLDAARRRCLDAIAADEARGAHGDAANARATLALVEGLEGNFAEADRLATQAAITLAGLGETNALAGLFEQLAWYRLHLEDVRTAGLLVGAAVRIRRDNAVARPVCDESRYEMTFAACADADVEEGASLTIDEVVSAVRTAGAHLDARTPDGARRLSAEFR